MLNETFPGKMRYITINTLNSLNN